ncbi:hypothetical protein RESH_04798 [Rhodopirellula europaea SH398]|uniref:Uncharacterized protein n=1 Tax=Rhodopirellula europaea SH398 TaxID=1263868 RepID=M5S9U2_9BACT|nr:hypothetical protein RESH_04798 [Rhodopirellula europaea SH398]
MNEMTAGSKEKQSCRSRIRQEFGCDATGTSEFWQIQPHAFT